MDIDVITRQLRTEEQETASRLERARAEARDTADEGVPDGGDLALQADLQDRRLAEAEAARIHLDELRAALARIDAGTYGLCVVDGEPIEEERLRALPWASHCLEHQALREEPGDQRRTL